MQFLAPACRALLKPHHARITPHISPVTCARRGFPRHATQSARRQPAQAVVAVLYQALEPPIINGVRKPAKPGGILRSLQYLAPCDIPLSFHADGRFLHRLSGLGG